MSKWCVTFDLPGIKQNLNAAIDILSAEADKATSFAAYVACVISLGQLISNLGEGLKDQAQSNLSQLINNQCSSAERNARSK